MYRFTLSLPLVLLTLLPLLTSCEEGLTDTDVRIPYIEELVVQGFLTLGIEPDTIRISRTLPPLEVWNAERAEVTDADVVISAGGGEHALRHTSHGRYVLDGLVIEAGRSYQLRVTSDDLMVTAVATIPESRPIWDVYSETFVNECSEDSVAPPHDLDQISSKLYVERTRVYSMIHELVQWRNDSLIDRFEIPFFMYYPEYPSGDLYTLTIAFCIDTEPPIVVIDSIYSTLYSYEPGFSRFYETRYYGKGDDLLFGGSVDDPHWNVRGDGFGWFFGRRVDYDTLVVVR